MGKGDAIAAGRFTADLANRAEFLIRKLLL
jgi:hypothetical protein